MTYPKPLSEKNLKKMYLEAGISPEQSSWLHDLFAAAANLYGGCSLRDLWKIYKQLMQRELLPIISRKKIIAFSAIVRREAQLYYVYEIDEMWPDEQRSDLDRLIVHRDLIGTVSGKIAPFYSLSTALDWGFYRWPFYVPDDFLSYTEPKPGKEENALFDFLCSLKVTAKECIPVSGDPYPCENKGKRLGEFSFLTKDESFDLNRYTKNAYTRKAFEKEYSGTEAEKLFRWFKKSERSGSGYWEFTAHTKRLFDELQEVGVELSEEQVETLIELLNDFHNNFHMWYIRGWAIVDILESPLFGPRIRRTFYDERMIGKDWYRSTKNKTPGK